MKIDKYEILKTFTYMQDNLTDEICERNNIILAFSECPEIWWNFALVNHIVSDDELRNIEDFFEKRDRMPSVYFSDDEKIKPLRNLLKIKNYEISAKDSWLF